jgi:glycosyltransferase involved in cell wall biosynthesis
VGTSGRRLTGQPLCSILIPAYNVDRYIAEAVESALSQTYRPIEVVIVNDGSTDGTHDAIVPYLDAPEVVYVDQANRGLAGARNSGFAASHGSLVALLDGDDTWMPERLDRCVRELRENPSLGWVTSDTYLIENGVRTQRKYRNYSESTVPPDRQLDEIARRNFMFVGGVIRRELFERYGTFDESLRQAEDYDLWIRFMLGGERVGLIEEPLGWYRMRDDSLSANSRAQWEAHLDVLERHLPALSALGAYGESRECTALARRLSRRGDRRGAARFARMAIRAAPDSLLKRAQVGASVGLTVLRGAR